MKTDTVRHVNLHYFAHQSILTGLHGVHFNVHISGLDTTFKILKMIRVTGKSDEFGKIQSNGREENLDYCRKQVQLDPLGSGSPATTAG